MKVSLKRQGEGNMQTYSMKEEKQTISKKCTMNQLMDESQLNQSEYKEVVFKEN